MIGKSWLSAPSSLTPEPMRLPTPIVSLVLFILILPPHISCRGWRSRYESGLIILVVRVSIILVASSRIRILHLELAARKPGQLLILGRESIPLLQQLDLGVALVFARNPQGIILDVEHGGHDEIREDKTREVFIHHERKYSVRDRQGIQLEELLQPLPHSCACEGEHEELHTCQDQADEASDQAYPLLVLLWLHFFLQFVIAFVCLCTNGPNVHIDTCAGQPARQGY
mmetsp:Transcript_43516/g.100158  ORF Transcript_43516/g.100158 Transcript_43516/m.100158 type:complete len:228 (+) Transcript_43516:2-685(+)